VLTENQWMDGHRTDSWMTRKHNALLHSAYYCWHKNSRIHYSISRLVWFSTRKTFCGMWYLPHGQVHNDWTVPI